MSAILPMIPMWVPSMDAVVSHWCASHAEARACLDATWGDRLPHGGQFFARRSETHG